MNFLSNVPPIQIHSPSGNSYYTLTESRVSGSPPNRRPPPIGVRKRTNFAPRSSSQADRISDHDTALWNDERAFEDVNETIRPSKPVDVGVVPLLGLPPFQTGKMSLDFLCPHDLHEGTCCRMKIS